MVGGNSIFNGSALGSWEVFAPSCVGGRSRPIAAVHAEVGSCIEAYPKAVVEGRQSKAEKFQALKGLINAEAHLFLIGARRAFRHFREPRYDEYRASLFSALHEPVRWT